MDCSTSGFPVHHQLPELAQTHIHRVSDAIQPSHPLLSPSIFPSIRVSSNESVLHIRWPVYWSYQLQDQFFQWIAELTSFRIDWFDLAAQGTHKKSSNTTVQNNQLFSTQLSIQSNSHIHIWLQWFWSPKINVCHCFHCFPIYLPWSDGSRWQYLSFLNVEF